MGFGKGWEQYVRDNPDRVASQQPAEGSTQPQAAPKATARGSTKAQVMNDTEARYDALLSADPTVAWRRYECVGLRLGDGLFYYPDFMVLRATDMALEFHEVKGAHVRRSGRDKYRAAANLYPFRFCMMQWADGAWECIHRSGTGWPAGSSQIGE